MMPKFKGWRWNWTPLAEANWEQTGSRIAELLEYFFKVPEVHRVIVDRRQHGGIWLSVKFQRQDRQAAGDTARFPKGSTPTCLG